jgi:Holliday junction resolvase
MPNRNKQKGNRFERELVKYLETYGINSRRAWGSDGRALGMHEEVDIVAGEDIRIQAKVRKKLPNYLLPNKEVDLQVFKQDRGEILVLMRLDDWIQDYKIIQEKDREIAMLKSELELCK